MSIKKLVLAYSGGLDTSVAIRWLADKYRCEVVAFCADVGQGEDLEAVRKKALATGASKVYVEDLREEFVRDFVFPALRAAAVCQGEYLLGTSLARPCIMKGMMAVVRAEGADAIAHGSTGKGNDQVRFELAAYQLRSTGSRSWPPWREWEFKSRSQLIEYTKTHGIPIEATLSKPYSVDRNLFHTSYEGGVLEDPWRAPDPEMFQRTRDAEHAPSVPRGRWKSTMSTATRWRWTAGGWARRSSLGAPERWSLASTGWGGWIWWRTVTCWHEVARRVRDAGAEARSCTRGTERWSR